MPSPPGGSKRTDPRRRQRALIAEQEPPPSAEGRDLLVRDSPQAITQASKLLPKHPTSPRTATARQAVRHPISA